MNKCAHSVYIPERLGDSKLSDCCSICCSIDPKLDYRYGKTDKEPIEVNTISGVYRLYKETGDPEVYAKLFQILIRFAGSIARKRFVGKWYIPDTRDVTRDAATHCMLNLAKYEEEKLEKRPGAKSAFSAWAHATITNFIKNWLDREVDWNTWSIDFNDRKNQIVDHGAGVDEKLFLKEVKALLTDEERQLFEMVASGVTQEEVGKELGIHQTSVLRRFQALTKKIRAMG